MGGTSVAAYSPGTHIAGRNEVSSWPSAIRREIGDAMGVATGSFNMALLYAQQGEAESALPLAQQAAQIWEQIGSPNAQQAQRLVAQLRGKSR